MTAAGMGSTLGPAELDCHELLLQLSGRLPDELLWRLRDWLAVDARAALAAVLPRELLRHRVGLSDYERDLLAGAVGSWGAAQRVLDAVLPVVVDRPLVADRPDPPGDTAALTAIAVVRGHPDCVELRQARRNGRRALVVLGGHRPWVLAGTLQRVLRAHGDRTPCVEVLPPHGERSAHQRAAIIGSAPLWRGV